VASPSLLKVTVTVDSCPNVFGDTRRHRRMRDRSTATGELVEYYKKCFSELFVQRLGTYAMRRGLFFLSMQAAARYFTG
jgi:hypothetical protein